MKSDASTETAKKPTDKQRLDYLQKQSNLMLWVARRSSTGRGYRVHTDPEIGAFSSVRDAIDAAMKADPFR